MTDVAALGVTATETGVSKVDKALMGLAASAGKAETATGRFTRSAAGIDAMFKSSGRSSRDAKTDVQAYAVEMDNLRAKHVPLFAASKRYEMQLNEIIRAEKLGAINARESAAAQDLLAASYARSAIAADSSAVSLMRIGRASQGTAGGMQNVGYQIQDFAAQVGAGTSATQALAQQLPQLLSGFGLMGIYAGTAAAVLIPIAGYFLNITEKAKSFEDTLSDLSDATQAVRDVTWQSTDSMIAKYGQLTESIMGAIAAQQQFALDSQMMAANDAVAALKTLTDEGVASIVNMQQQIEVLRQQPIIDDSRILDLTENMNYLAGEMGLTVTQAVNLNSALQDYSGAKGLVDKAAAATAVRVALEGTSLAGGEMARSINQSELALYEAVSAAQKLWVETNVAEAAAKALSIAAPNGSWMDGAIGSVGTLTGKLWAAVTAKNALATAGATSTAGMGRGSSMGGPALDPYGFRSGLAADAAAGLSVGGGGAGGGGGGGSDPYQANLDRLMASLMTERETVEKWYADNEVILNDRRAMELLGAAGHKEAMLDLERQYHEKLSKIKDDSDAYNLGSTARLFGDLNTMAGGGYDGLIRAQKAFAAAEALINTYRGAAQELARPTATPWQKFAAVAKVVASGMGLVNAIKGGGKASSGGGGSSGQTAAASSQPAADRVTTVSFTGDPFMVAIANSVMAQMYEASGNGRVLIKA